MSIRQRIRDVLREREIRRLTRCELEAISAGDKARARTFDVIRLATIRGRSDDQVKRMETHMGLRARTTVKHHVMQAFCRGLLPTSVVTFVFRLFRLRSL